MVVNKIQDRLAVQNLKDSKKGAQKINSPGESFAFAEKKKVS